MKTCKRPALRESGVVLPIVLVVMMVVTMLVVTQVRRGTVDERLAGNWSRAISGQTAAESLVRYCEAHLFANEFAEARAWKNKVPSEFHTNLNQAAWASGLPATDRITFTADILPPGATGTCIVEDASSELAGSIYQAVSGTPGGAGITDPYLWKYRITVLLTLPDPTAFGSVVYRAQSEVRFLIT